MTIAEKITKALMERARVVAYPDYDLGIFVQSLLDEHYGKPIDKCLNIIEKYTFGDDPAKRFYPLNQLKSKLEAMKEKE